jgi:hypothetical protein
VKLICSLVLVHVVAGCQSLDFGWKAPPEGAKFAETLDEQFPLSGEQIKLLKDEYEKPETLAPRRKIVRNRILNRLIRKVQAYHELVETDLYESTAKVGSALDILTLAFTTTATAVSGESLKTVFAALGAGSSGTKLALEQNILREKSREAILSAMKTLRAKQLEILYRGMGAEDDVYPLERGVSDVVAYFNAGSIASAVAELVKTAGESQKAAEGNLDQLQRGQVPAPAEKK